MPLSDTRDISLIAGVSPVPSQTINRLQDEVVKLWRGRRGWDVSVVDHFFGVAGGAPGPMWLATNTVLADDSIKGAFGAARITNAGALSLGGLLPVGSVGSWGTYIRFRLNNYAGWTANHLLQIFLISTLPAHTLSMQIKKGAVSDHYTFSVDGGAAIDTGIAADANYHTLEYRFDAVSFTAIFDGVTKYTGALPVDWANFATVTNNPLFSATTSGATPDVYVDSMGFGASYYPVAGGSAAPGATSGHIEQGVVTFDGSTDFIDVVFNVDFPDTNYQFKYGVLLAAATDDNFILNLAPTPAVALTHGFRIKPASRPAANAKVSWEVSR